MKSFLPLALALWGALSAAAQVPRISLGTLAPRGSVYHQSLQSLAESWRQLPGGGVKLNIYPDGAQGGEAEMVKLMRLGSLQAGLLTAVGLSEIEKSVGGLQNIPMLFRNFDELDYVGSKLQPMLEKRLEEKGFVVLFWVDAGWVRYFSKRPFQTPDDLKKMKTFVWAGDTDQIRIMKKYGYNPVPIETSDILPSLNTGLIDTVPLPPIFALSGQMDLRANHMLNLNWAPLVGACVVRKAAWEKIPAALREKMLVAAGRAGNEIRASSRKESDSAVEAMKKRGLKVSDINPGQVQLWQDEVEKLYPDIRGSMVPADVFDEAVRLVKEYRANPPRK